MLCALAWSCEAFMVPAKAPLASATAALPATTARLAPPVTMMAAKKPVKKIVKKPVKKVVKKPVKKPLKRKVAKKPVKRGGSRNFLKSDARKGQLVDPGLDPAQWGKALGLGKQVAGNFGGQGIPLVGVAGAGIWVLLILRYTIFYGFFGTTD